MKILRSNYVYMAGADDGTAGGGGGSGAPAPAPAPSPTPSPAPAPAPSVLGGAANNEGDQPQPQPHERFAEKYRVFKEDGAFDLEATAFKAEEARAALETKLGSGDIAPKSVDEYKIDKLSGDFDVAAVMADPTTKSFLARAHAKGMTNAQVQDVLDFALTEWAPALITDAQVVSGEQCTAALRETWQSDDDFKTNTAASYRAVKAYAAEGDGLGSFAALEKKFGNDPDFIAFTARIGKEVSEDRAPDLAAVMGGKSIGELESDPAYLDPKNPNHARVNKAIKAYYDRNYGQAAAM